MTNEMLEPYYQALARLKAGKPQMVAKGTKITNDAVSLEAGRKKVVLRNPGRPSLDL
jgi:hypothetical protein